MAILLAHHVEDLRRSGLTDKTIRESGVYSESDPLRIAETLNWKGPANIGPALVFRFREPETGNFNCFARIKPDRPRPEAGKYEQPIGALLRAYFTQFAIGQIWIDDTTPLIFTEGEKKALAGCQCGLTTIGLTGIWGWQKKRPKDKAGKGVGPRELIDDLATISYRGRRVGIAFDFDSRRNPDVNQAAAELARVLHELGAIPTIIAMPAGTRDDRGIPEKNAMDDLSAAHGDDVLRDLINSQIAPPSKSVALSDYRRELSRSRIESIKTPGIYFDSSPTGAGKTHADMDAAAQAGSSLTILPTHKNGREVKEAYQARGLNAEAFPQINGETCENLEVANKAIASGLSASSAVCPRCKFKDGCEYHAILESAEHAAHRIATHHRAGMSFEQLARGRKYVAIHEDAAAVLRPGFEIATGLKDVAAVVESAIAIEQSRQFGEDCDRSLEYCLRLMLKSTEDLFDIVESAEETRSVELPIATSQPRGLDAILFDAMQLASVWPASEPMHMVKLIATGGIAELIARVDEVFRPGAKKAVCRSIVGIRKAVLPERSTIWIADATADLVDVEMMAGRPVVDATPQGSIERKHPISQWPIDVTKATGKPKVIGILQSIFFRLPFKRFGIITHREHVPTIESSALLSPEHRNRISRIDHFRSGGSRGSNEWLDDCDCMVILGTPRVPPQAIKNRLVALGMPAAATRPDKWTAWGKDYWSGTTVDGRRVTVRTLAYRDHDWHRAHRSIVRAELIQAAGRGRAIVENGIPAIVVATEDLGLPLIEFGDDIIDQDDGNLLTVVGRLIGHSSYNIYIGQVSDNDSPQVVNSPIANVSDRPSSVSTGEVAKEIGKSERQTQRTLAKLERLGFLKRVGERGGWLVSRPDPIDLYSLAGLPSPRATSPSTPISFDLGDM